MNSVLYSGVRKSNVVDKVEGARYKLQVTGCKWGAVLFCNLKLATCNFFIFYSNAAIPVISAPVINK